jgi:hypothetical protein
VRKRVREIVAKAASVLRWGGLRAVLARGAKELLGPLIRVERFFFLERDLTEPAVSFEATVPLEVRPAEAKDFETFADRFRAAGRDRREIARRLARGDVCFVAISGGCLAHFAWMAFSPAGVDIDEVGVGLRLGGGEVYFYDALTFPEWRGRKVILASAAARLSYARARGYGPDGGLRARGQRAEQDPGPHRGEEDQDHLAD